MTKILPTSFELASAWDVASQVLSNNVLSKFIVSVMLYLFGHVFVPHEQLFVVMFVVYCIDFSTGIAKSVFLRSFSSARFFRGAIKLGVYCLLVATAHSLDIALLTGSLFTTLMFAFIITTEASSVLENLQDLGFPTPEPLKKYLASYSQKLWREKLAGADADSDTNGDIADLARTYPSKVRDKVASKRLKIILDTLGQLSDKLENIKNTRGKTGDLHLIRAHVRLLVQDTERTLKILLTRESVPDELIDLAPLLAEDDTITSAQYIKDVIHKLSITAYGKVTEYLTKET